MACMNWVIDSHKNHELISSVGVASKLFAGTVLHRLSNTCKMRLRENQVGFRSGRCYTDQVLTVQ